MNSRYFFLPTIAILVLIAVCFEIYRVEMTKSALHMAEETVKRFERIDCTIVRVDSLYLCKAAEVSYKCTGNTTIVWDNYWSHQQKTGVNWSRDSFRSAVTKEFSLNSTEIFYDGRKCCGEKLYMQSRPLPTDLNIYKDNRAKWASIVALVLATTSLFVGSFIEYVIVHAEKYCLATGKVMEEPAQVMRRIWISGLGMILSMVAAYVVIALKDY